MKKSFLIISMLVLTVFNLNATSLKTNVDALHTSEAITENDLIQIYEWSVETATGNASGTAPNLNKANKMIALFGSNDIILGKKITSYYVLKTEVADTGNRRYYWEVESTNGTAKGYSSSEQHANSMINLVAKGEIITYKIITSNKLN